MAFINEHEYYHNEGNVPEELNWGSYQYVTLENIVRNFQMVFTGPNKDIHKVDEHEIRYHAKQAIQELHMDALKEVCIAEITTADDLTIILPHDYVNLVRISVYDNEVLRPLIESQDTLTARAHLQDHQANILVDEDGNILTGTSTLKYDVITSQKKTEYLGTGDLRGRRGYLYDGAWYFDYQFGSRFGLDTSRAFQNGVYQIDRKEGVIHFSSELQDKDMILEYVSDGMENGNDADVRINKMFRDYVNRYIRWMILDNMDGVPRWKRIEAKRQKHAEWRNAKIRISGLNPKELVQTLRMRSKWLK